MKWRILLELTETTGSVQTREMVTGDRPTKCDFRRSPLGWALFARRISRVKFGLYHPDHAVFLEERTECGRPAPSMRFRTVTPMAASVR